MIEHAWEETKLEFINKMTQNKEFISNIFYTLIALMIIYIIKSYIMRMIHKKGYDPAKEFSTKKAAKTIVNIVGIIILFIIWGKESGQYIISFIGFFTAGLAIAMKDIILNMIGSLYILWANPFKVGDRIEIAGQIGDVIDIRLLHFTMLEVGNRIAGEQSTGRVIHLPNLYVFNYPLANYEKGFKYIWNELTIPMDKTSNWELAKVLIGELVEKQTSAIMEEAKEQIEEAGRNYPIYYNNLTPTIYTELKEDKIVLTIRYLCEARKVRSTEHILWEAILKLFNNHSEIRFG